MMSIRERLKEIIENSKDVEEYLKKFELTKNTIKKIKDVSEIDEYILEELSNRYDINFNWLISGEGSRLDKENDANKYKKTFPKKITVTTSEGHVIEYTKPMIEWKKYNTGNVIREYRGENITTLIVEDPIDKSRYKWVIDREYENLKLPNPFLKSFFNLDNYTEAVLKMMQEMTESEKKDFYEYVKREKQIFDMKRELEELKSRVVG